MTSNSRPEEEPGVSQAPETHVRSHRNSRECCAHRGCSVNTEAVRYDERTLNSGQDQRKAVYCPNSYEGNPECFKPSGAILRLLF